MKTATADQQGNLLFPELLFAFVAPIGANLESSIEALTKRLKVHDYQVEPIKISDFFDKLKNNIKPQVPLEKSPEHRRYETYIKYGNQLRSDFDRDSILAELAVAEICVRRLKKFRKSVPQKQAYILFQFKRSEEIELLRNIYGKLFFQISVCNRRSVRVDNLATQFAAADASGDSGPYRAFAENLVCVDENEIVDRHGQRVSKIFHEADFIVNEDSDVTVEKQVGRFVDLVFGANDISPTRVEYGMFLAQAAALRTIDLSRQVGAAVLSPDSEIITLGSNEVPKAGGGTYWEDSKFDDREYKRKVDSNDKQKEAILNELLDILGVRSEEIDPVKLKSISESALMGALEYGRIVHAEMGAISDAARLGRSVRDATLFCTTFPCHMCAKHIIASGIKDVCFLEPYPKSLAATLHGDSVQVEGIGRGKYSSFPAVRFFHFSGITPRRYGEIFKRGKRKDEKGKFKKWKEGYARPITIIKLPFYFALENFVLRNIEASISDEALKRIVLPKSLRAD